MSRGKPLKSKIFSEVSGLPVPPLVHGYAPALRCVLLRCVVAKTVHTVMDEDAISKVFGHPRYRQVVDRHPVRFDAEAEHNGWSSIVACYIC